MPILKNPRYEVFAQALAACATATEAYIEAGYKAHDGNAARLRGKEAIQARVKEILTRAADRSNVTLEKLGADLEEARLLAKRIKQPTAMIAATMGTGKLYGLITDKFNVTGTLTLAELVAASLKPAAEAPVEDKDDEPA